MKKKKKNQSSWNVISITNPEINLYIEKLQKDGLVLRYKINGTSASSAWKINENETLPILTFSPEDYLSHPLPIIFVIYNLKREIPDLANFHFENGKSLD